MKRLYEFVQTEQFADLFVKQIAPGVGIAVFVVRTIVVMW